MAEKSQVSLVDDYVAEYQGIQAQMGDPEVAGDQDQFRKLSKRYAELQPIINVYNDLTQAQEDHEAAAEIANEDKEFAEGPSALRARLSAWRRSWPTCSPRVTSTTATTSSWSSRPAPAARRPRCSLATLRACTRSTARSTP